MAVETWNVVNLEPPPFITVCHQRNQIPTALVDDAELAYSKTVSCIQHLANTRLLDIEMTVLRKLILRFSNNLGSHKSLQNMKKMKKCLDRWKNLSMSEILKPLAEDLKILSTMATSSTIYMQSGLCLNYILHKLMAGSALLGQTTIYCMQTYLYAQKELLIGNFITKMIVFMALASRIRLLCIENMKYMTQSFQHSYRLIQHIYGLEQISNDVPSDLDVWLTERGYCTVVSPYHQDKMADSSGKLDQLLAKYTSGTEEIDEANPSDIFNTMAINSNILGQSHKAVGGELTQGSFQEETDGGYNCGDMGEEVEREHCDSDSSHHGDGPLKNSLQNVSEVDSLNTKSRIFSHEAVNLCHLALKRIKKTPSVKSVKKQLISLKELSMEYLPKSYRSVSRLMPKCRSAELTREQYQAVLGFVRRLKKKCSKEANLSKDTSEVTLDEKTHSTIAKKDWTIGEQSKDVSPKVQKKKSKDDGRDLNNEIRTKSSRGVDLPTDSSIQDCESVQELVSLLKIVRRGPSLSKKENKNLKDIELALTAGANETCMKKRKMKRFLHDAKVLVCEFFQKQSTKVKNKQSTKVKNNVARVINCENNNIANTEKLPSVLVISSKDIVLHFKKTVTNRKKLMNFPKKLRTHKHQFSFLNKDYTLSEKNMKKLDCICKKNASLMSGKTLEVLQKSILSISKVFKKQLKGDL